MLYCLFSVSSVAVQNFLLKVVRPRISQRDLSGRETNFSPAVTSPLQLIFKEGRTTLTSFLGDPTPLLRLAKVPSKASSTFLSISDILTNSGTLKGQTVDVLAAVRQVGAVIGWFKIYQSQNPP